MGSHRQLDSTARRTEGKGEGLTCLLLSLTLPLSCFSCDGELAGALRVDMSLENNREGRAPSWRLFALRLVSLVTTDRLQQLQEQVGQLYQGLSSMSAPLEASQAAGAEG